MRKYLLGFALILSLLASALSASSNIQREDENRSSQEAGIEPQIASEEENAMESEREDIAGREEWFYRQRAFPFKKIPRGARERAMKYARKHLRPPQDGKIQPNVTGLSWQFFGPDSIPNGPVYGVPGPVSGRVNALAFDPHNSNVIYLGASDGGVWKTTDGGNSWTPLTDYQPSLAIGSIAIDPTNSSIVYASTGAGILKTTDGGATWTQQGAATFQGISIDDLAIDPTNPQILYAAATNGVYKGTFGGQVWTQLASAPSGINVDNIKIDPTNHNTLYAAQYGGGIFRTDDGGGSWYRVGIIGFPDPGQFKRVAIGLAPSNPHIIYAALEEPASGNLLNILRSTDQGNSWGIELQPEIDPNNKPYTYCQCDHDNVIAVSPNDPNTVLWGGCFSLSLDNRRRHSLGQCKCRNAY